MTQRQAEKGWCTTYKREQPGSSWGRCSRQQAPTGALHQVQPKPVSDTGTDNYAPASGSLPASWTMALVQDAGPSPCEEQKRKYVLW